MKKTNKIIFIIIILIGIISLIFVNNNDFIYKKTIMKITKIELVNEEIYTNSLGLEEKHYNELITGIITNGSDKGKKITLEYESTYSNVVTEKYKVGNKVFLDKNSIDSLKRDSYVTFMIFIFIISIFLVGKLRGLLAVLSVTLNTIIFYLGLDLYFNGMNLLLLCMLESVIFTILSLLISNGKNKKTLAAIISVFVSMIVLLIMSLIIVKFTNYSGVSFNEISFLNVPLKGIVITELMIGGFGAIMDVSMTMSSSIGELIEKDKNIKTKSLIKSGKEIGKDIMGTMVNVIFFTYLCSGLPTFVLAIRNGFSLHNYIVSNFNLEITRFLVGSIGIILAIPIGLFISIKILKRGDKDE